MVVLFTRISFMNGQVRFMVDTSYFISISNWVWYDTPLLQFVFCKVFVKSVVVFLLLKVSVYFAPQLWHVVVNIIKSVDFILHFSTQSIQLQQLLPDLEKLNLENAARLQHAVLADVRSAVPRVQHDLLLLELILGEAGTH